MDGYLIVNDTYLEYVNYYEMKALVNITIMEKDSNSIKETNETKNEISEMDVKINEYYLISEGYINMTEENLIHSDKLNLLVNKST
jgi:hypothetical protein